MKKTLLIISLAVSSAISFGQATETEVLNEDFSTGIDANLDGFTLSQGIGDGFDGSFGIGELGLGNGFVDLSWNGALPENTDSLLIEFKIGKTTTDFANVFDFNGTLEVEAYIPLFAEYKGTALNGGFLNFYETQDEYLIGDSSSYFQCERIITDVPSSTVILLEMISFPDQIEMDSDLGSYVGETQDDVATEFCNAEFPGDAECISTVTGQLFSSPFSALRLDDVKITAYSSDVTSTNEKVSVDKEIIGAYNLLGLSVDANTKNESIILKYSDGSSERVFNQE